MVLFMYSYIRVKSYKALLKTFDLVFPFGKKLLREISKIRTSQFYNLQ